MRIHVHLGVHKTATTFIQSQLANNRSMLAGGGYAFAGIWVVRKQFTRFFDVLAWFDRFWGWLTRPWLKRKLDRLLAQANPSDTFILSDENIAGLISTSFLLGSLYPQSARRTRILGALLDGHEPHYFLCIRRYQEYLTSSWLQMASRGKAPSFERYLAKFPPDGSGWADMVAGIADVCGAANITVWTYDWFAEDPSRVFGLLAPGIAFSIPEEELRRDVLPSLTLKGVKLMAEAKKQLNRDELKRLATLIRTFPFDEPNPRLEITDRALIAAYDDKYRADLDRIRALGVTLHG